MQTATRRCISYTLPWDDAPVDLSFIFEGEKPAGRHGFMQAKGARLVFEDGTEARFWGTNFNSAANFPPHEYSRIVARRLAKFGCNLVRFHQMDADYSTPNIFEFTKGRRRPDTQSLDPESLDRLDYLIHCLKQEGIYIYMDLLTYRIFKSGDDVPTPEKMGSCAKPYSTFDPHLIALQKKFNEQLWTHVNPYTQLAYKDEPAIVLTDVTNENDVFTFTNAPWIEPYLGQLQKRFLAWAGEKGLAITQAPSNFGQYTPEIMEFLIGVQKTYYIEMIEHMRGLGVRIPITGTNWAAGSALLEAQMVTDFTDSHTYWIDWTWNPTEKRFRNKSLLGERAAWLSPISHFRVLHKPLFVSEWDYPWPNEYRVEATLQLASVAAFQGWSGAAVHTYRYDCREHVDQIGAPISADAIGGIAYRGGMFDTFNDPAKFGLFYHAALMLRRGDVREAAETAEIAVSYLTEKNEWVIADDLKGHEGASETHKIGIRLPGAPARSDRQIPMNTSVLLPEGATEVRSDTGELYRNMAKRYAVIDSPRTKVVYGFLAGAGALSLKGLKITARTDFAAIAISSLTDAEIPHSDNLLLTAVGRADNTGAEYNAEHTLQLKTGHGPIQIEVIEAELELDTDVNNLKIWAINPAGMQIGAVPVTYEAGKAKFTIGGPFPSMYYLIQRA